MFRTPTLVVMLTAAVLLGACTPQTATPTYSYERHKAVFETAWRVDFARLYAAACKSGFQLEAIGPGVVSLNAYALSPGGTCMGTMPSPAEVQAFYSSHTLQPLSAEQMRQIFRQYQSVPSSVVAYTGDDARSKLGAVKDVENAIAILLEDGR